ncbi:MAG: hypothetical protein ABJL99_22770 [Aliishimia sp.]
MRVYAALFIVFFGLTNSFAEAETARPTLRQPARDIWHQVTYSSPFFSQGTATLRIAGVIQSDGYFARIILGGRDQGAYVTVNLPGTAPVSTLRSDLVFSNGGIMSRIITGDDLEAQIMTSSESVTYSFSIAREDIRGFRSASTWTLTQGEDRKTRITLKGSSKAIQRASTDPRPLPAPLIQTDTTLDPRHAVFADLPTAPQ